MSGFHLQYRDPYKFGLDPSWRGSRSELPFLNSLKMKMSILFGLAQMNLGIILSYFDAKFYGNSLDIRYQFIPQMIFLNSLFGYLALIKWCTGSQADLYHVMVYMFLSPIDDLGDNQLFWGQTTADCPVASGSCSSSMDAISETIHLKEASQREISRSYLWHAGHIRDGSGCRT
ncbi:uncharacterized protein A4U43_C08F34410 [Asparagus officinalis]|nr:uncharacterized protein A4U43_C08F34410 [Asparagus officinalis]